MAGVAVASASLFNQPRPKTTAMIPTMTERIKDTNGAMRIFLALLNAASATAAPELALAGKQ
jgi:hypothetical protein